MSKENAICVENLTKRFGDVAALEAVNVTFGENKIYGLLGRNGAGKSTLLNVITNRLFPTGGRVLIDGQPAMENDQALGKLYCMSEKDLYPETLRVKEVFSYTKLFYPSFDTAYANDLCKQFGLDPKKKLKGLSTGYTSIFKLIVALASGASYLLLDEPVLGLDANHRELFYKLLLELYSEHPKTIILSTHLIEEVSDLIEQVVIIKQGKILLDQPVEEVLKLGYCVSGKASEVDAYAAGKQILSEESLGGLKTVCIQGRAGQVPETLEVTALDLQKLFIKLTNA